MEKKYKVGLVITIAFVVWGFISTISQLVLGNNPNGEFDWRALIDIIIYICIFYYVFVGYKKPHGNLLRNLMLVFVLAFVTKVDNPTTALACVLIAFMAGRLNKFKQNCIILVVVLGILVYMAYGRINAPNGASEQLFNSVLMPVVLNKIVMWIALTAAYITRYFEHKEAGLEG